jgi:hypothetical protein
MDEQERRPLTLVDVVDRAALDLDPAAFRRNHLERDPLRELFPTGGARARLHRLSDQLIGLHPRPPFSLHPTRRDTGRRRDSFDPSRRDVSMGVTGGRAVSS